MEIELSIVLLTYNHWELTLPRLVELTQKMPWEGAELVWVDNGSTDETTLQGTTFWNQHFDKPFQYLRLSPNLGFDGGFNAGVAKAKGKNLLLLSNDVKINNSSFVNDILSLVKNDDRILLGGRILQHDTGWNVFEVEDKKYLVPYCEGYALALTRKAWDDLGGFDPLYHPYDFEDVDLSLTALSKGFILAEMPSEWFTHFCAKTINQPDRSIISLANREKFYNKWKENFAKVLKEYTS